MDEASDDEVEMPPPKIPSHQPPMPAGQPPLPKPDEAVIVRSYDPKQARPAPPPETDQYLISPLTQEKIPAHKLQEHMKISMCFITVCHHHSASNVVKLKYRIFPQFC